MHEDLVNALNEIEDPELGIGIVDLGLVYGAEWSASGIEVDFTTTTPTCPFGDTLLALIDELLHRRFREAASIRVRLVRHPTWTPERLSDAARQKLGWAPSPARTRSAFASRRDVWKN
jgi:metal-sulfur cluster biosynthetic enzyme